MVIVLERKYVEMNSYFRYTVEVSSKSIEVISFCALADRARSFVGHRFSSMWRVLTWIRKRLRYYWQKNNQGKDQTPNPTTANTTHRSTQVSRWFFFGCQLLGYVSPAVRPSVSYNNAKRTIPVRENNKNVYDHWPKQWNELIKQIRKQINPPRKSASRRESRSGVKSSMCKCRGI